MITQSARERSDSGKAAREQIPRSSHAAWSPGPDRPDPVATITAQNADRLQWLVPVRHSRMAESAFAFYRGAAAIMAADLATTPSMGVSAQLCGDAHLGNFGTFASAERQQVFDVNDFDEALPGPWEWDLKRLAASTVIASRDNGFPDDVGKDAAIAAADAYGRAMAAFAQLPVLQVWYQQLDLQQIADALPSKTDRKSLDRGLAKARKHNSVRALGKLTETIDGNLQIRSQPPLLIPLRHLTEHVDPHLVRTTLEENLKEYIASLASDRRFLMGRFTVQDIALKVVGVGSVGRRAWVVLLTGRDHAEPLFLQIKEATASVLEAHLPKSTFANPGERVVTGRRLVQASPDIFLGWSKSAGGTAYYWRQFHDMKGSADVASMSAERLQRYAALCGWTLAHGHARSGDAIAVAGYLGSGKSFAKAVGEFAVAYADQNDADYAAFQAAIADGRIEAKES